MVQNMVRNVIQTNICRIGRWAALKPSEIAETPCTHLMVSLHLHFDKCPSWHPMGIHSSWPVDKSYVARLDNIGFEETMLMTSITTRRCEWKKRVRWVIPNSISIKWNVLFDTIINVSIVLEILQLIIDKIDHEFKINIQYCLEKVILFKP